MIDDYITIVGKARIDNLKLLAERLHGKTIQNINSTALGGGVAEILNRWRCHIDLSSPQADVWEFMRGFVKNYDSSVFSSPAFAQAMEMRKFLIPPSIDPLSDKNKELSTEEIDRVMRKYAIPRDKPIITQISRFDRLKDPVGVVEVYKRVKKYIDCRLVLAGGTAVDDPEGIQVYNEVKERAGKDEDIHLILMEHSDIDVNAIQRASTVIMQKSVKEGFGLTISEALWKRKPVVAGYTGGIPLQIAHKYSGMLCHSIDGAALSVKQLLNSPDFAKRLGENGREHVRNNFLITRHIQDYLLLFLAQFNGDDVVYL